MIRYPEKTKYFAPVAAIILIIIIVLISRSTIENIIYENKELQVQMLFYEAQIEQLFEHYNHTLHNPTYSEMVLFIKQDQTDKKEYYSEKWNCINFSVTLIANATVQGIRCGFVMLDFDKIPHAVVVFETVEKEMIYIDPQGDAVVQFKIGETYPEYGKLRRMTVIWTGDS